MKVDPEIDELLNCFIDGELTTREQAEVQRLLAHDAKIEQRLQQLQKCKMLVGSLPAAEAPVEMAEQVKASLERRTLLGEQSLVFAERSGARHLLVRKVLAAAAMIGLVAVLATTIYTIVAPQEAPPVPVAMEGQTPPGEIEAVESRSGAMEMEFHGRLELKTSDLIAVDAFINRTIKDNSLSGAISPARQQEKSVYSLSCSREGLNLLLADLGGIWEKFDSATLFVETEVFGRPVVVDAVTAMQVAEIVNQESLQRCAEVAKDFALLNNIAQRLPGREILAAIDDRSRSLITLPKPVLTGKQKTTEKPAGRVEDKQKMHLNIVVVGGE